MKLKMKSSMNAHVGDGTLNVNVNKPPILELKKVRKIDWSHVYLVGWYDATGEMHTVPNFRNTGNYEIVHVLVFGNDEDIYTHGPPMKANYRSSDGVVWDKFEMQSIREEEIKRGDWKNGVMAFGVYIPEGFDRDKRNELETRLTTERKPQQLENNRWKIDI